MKPSKYRAQPVVIDGVRFASKAEGRRYEELKLLVSSGRIHSLELQPKYPIKIEDVKICSYVADFLYFDCAKNWWVTEDVKGVKTPVYRLKKKLVKALYGIDILET